MASPQHKLPFHFYTALICHTTVPLYTTYYTWWSDIDVLL
jgi:hypothetical protein